MINNLCQLDADTHTDIANEAVSFTSLIEYGKARESNGWPSQQFKVHMHDDLEK